MTIIVFYKAPQADGLNVERLDGQTYIGTIENSIYFGPKPDSGNKWLPAPTMVKLDDVTQIQIIP